MSDGMRCGGHTGQLTGLEGCVVVVAPWSGDLAALAAYTATLANGLEKNSRKRAEKSSFTHMGLSSKSQCGAKNELKRIGVG